MDPFHGHSSMIPRTSRSPRDARPGPQSGCDPQDQGPLATSSDGVAAGKEGAAQTNARDSRGSSEAAESERIELQRVLRTMARNMHVASQNIAVCKKMCASVPLDSLQVSTLRDLGGLVNEIEDASESVSEEAAGMFQLVSTMRETAAARVEREMELDDGIPPRSHAEKMRRAREGQATANGRPRSRQDSFRSSAHASSQSRSRSLRYTRRERHACEVTHCERRHAAANHMCLCARVRACVCACSCYYMLAPKPSLQIDAGTVP